MAVSSIASLNMIGYRMVKPSMCLLMLGAIGAIVRERRKNDFNFLLGLCHDDANRCGIFFSLLVCPIDTL